MKKILIFTCILCLIVLNVNAETVILESDFENIMKNNGFEISYIEDGYSAYNGDVTFIYNKYETNDKAYERFLMFANTQNDEYATIKNIEDYNLDNSISDSYNMVSYVRDATSEYVTDEYYYIYKVNNYLIYGYGDVSKQDKIKTLVEKIVDNDYSGDPIFVSEKTTPVSEDANPFITYGILGVILLLVIVIFAKVFKNLKSNKSKE